ncbi:MAG: DNA alkylation repair protein [Deltaproteobacteria bacterium]|nr:DNA alkylation repair protein [Deltaproteobacteria bacterium]
MAEQDKVKEILKKLKSLGNPIDVAGMARFGINPKNACGVKIPVLRQMSKEIGKNHLPALKLWDSGIHEARILAGMVDEPKHVNEKQAETWVRDFDSWDVCDQVCMNLFEDTTRGYKKAVEWSKRKEEFVKRAGFVMMARLAVSDKDSDDKRFINLLPLIKKQSADDRRFVKKAVNWALRQIGKRNGNLRNEAIKLAEEIMKDDSKTAKWIAADALRELK